MKCSLCIFTASKTDSVFCLFDRITDDCKPENVHSKWRGIWFAREQINRISRRRKVDHLISYFPFQSCQLCPQGTATCVRVLLKTISVTQHSTFLKPVPLISINIIKLNFRECQELNPGLRGEKPECYFCALHPPSTNNLCCKSRAASL